MKRVLVGLTVGIATGAGLVGAGVAINSRVTTLTRLSPDETLRASLVERGLPSLDRNFQVQLENLVKDETTTLYRSPDEGRPYGSERLIWSKDGKWLLLVGRHFFVNKDLFLDNGDQLYFLHNIKSGQSLCNAANTNLTQLTERSIDGIEFTEPIKLKPR